MFERSDYKTHTEKAYQTEALLQSDCFAFWSTHYRRQSLLFAVANGGTRDKREAMQLKAQGVTAGVSDLVLMLPAGRSVFIEMKNGKQPLRDVQQQFKAKATYLGHDTREAYSFADFCAILADLMPTDL